MGDGASPRWPGTIVPATKWPAVYTEAAINSTPAAILLALIDPPGTRLPSPRRKRSRLDHAGSRSVSYTACVAAGVPADGFPYFKYSVGTTNMLSSVEVVNPHMITIAMGV